MRCLRCQLICLACALTPAAFAQEFDLSWRTIDGGGGYSAAGGFELEGTIGQPDAGQLAGGKSIAVVKQQLAEIGRVDDAVRFLIRIFLNVIVHGINNFAGVDAAGVIPEQPIVNRRNTDTGLQVIIASAQQRQFFAEEGRLLAAEGE